MPDNAATTGSTASDDPAQLTDDELALELESCHEEEDREQPVGRPLLEGQVQMERRPAR